MNIIEIQRLLTSVILDDTLNHRWHFIVYPTYGWYPIEERTYKEKKS